MRPWARPLLAATMLLGACATGSSTPRDSQSLPPDERVGSDASPAGAWVTLSAGKLSVGSPAGEACRSQGEQQREVTLTRSFDISASEVTQGLFKEVMGYNPAKHAFCFPSCPVESVSWHEAAAYCNALSARIGLQRCYSCTGTDATVACSVVAAFANGSISGCTGYRLPTEAEWEHAYRAGTTDAYYSGASAGAGPNGDCCVVDANLDKIGWYDKNSGGVAHAVGQKEPNAWGLRDMAGNVAEWVHDGWQDVPPGGASADPVGPETSAQRTVRGGAYYFCAGLARAARRDGKDPTVREPYIGLRCVRSR
jgi:formylglycine-generating enzyme required for sulfatase activity